jgi:serine/threonine-protein kinase
LREARLASSLRHPNVCRIHAVEEHQGRPFIVMDLCEGETLQARLERGRLPIPEVVEVLRQVSSALAAVHQAGIVHRDLKPINVMLGGSALRLMDFGLATRMASEETLTPLTRTGQVVGTLAYMSPEQVRGEPLEAYTDLWSLGVVAYEMLAGERPFQGPTGGAVLQQILHFEPRPIRELRPETLPALERLLARLLRKQLGERMSSAAEVLRALELD